LNPLVYRQVAKHLAELNRPEEAINLLGECIQGGIGVFPCLVDMAYHAYRFQGWEPASQLLSKVVGVEGANPGHWLRLCHARIEAGDIAGAEAGLRHLSGELARRGLPAIPEGDEVFEPIYLRLSELHREGRTAAADALLDLLAAGHPFAARAAGSGADAEAGTDALRRRLDAAWQAWEAGDTPLPAFSREAHGARHGACPDLSGVRVLMVMRRYFNYTANSREHELFMMFRRTAAVAGIDLRMVEGDALVMPYGHGWRRQADALDAVVEAINDMRPDIVIFDALCEQIALGETFGPDVHRAVLGDLKRRLGFKLVGFYPDAWTRNTRRALEAIRGLADGWWTSSTAVFDGEPEFDRRHLNLPTPFDPSFYPDRGPGIEAARTGARFFGSVAGYNYTRSLWLRLMERLGTPCAVTASNHGAGPLSAEEDYQRYADALMASRVSLNFSSRNLTTHITTGRVFETVLARALLLEEDNRATRNFFVPYVHYVPFRSAPELDAAVRLFLEDEPLRRRMVDAAGAWMAGNYAPETVWRTVISFALGLPDPREAP
jgi:hypothetical protein